MRLAISYVSFLLQDFGPNCGPTGPISFGLTNEEKHEVTNLHNKYRSRVAKGQENKGNPGPQKPAANMWSSLGTVS